MDRFKVVVAVLTSTTLVRLSFPGYVASTIPSGHFPEGVISLVTKTRSPFWIEGWLVSHSWRCWREVRYSLDHWFQKLCTIWVTFSHLLPRGILVWVVSGTGTRNKLRMIKKCAGVSSVKLVLSLLIGMSGLELNTASIRHNTVESSENVRSCLPTTRRKCFFAD